MIDIIKIEQCFVCGVVGVVWCGFNENSLHYSIGLKARSPYVTPLRKDFSIWPY